MADIARPCNSQVYENLNCCDKNIGISVVQPKCHCLPDGSVVTNPCFVSSLNKSFWTYKIITDCNDTTNALTSFVIPICQIVKKEIVSIYEKIDGCGEWTAIPYTLVKTDPEFGEAAEGFQFLKVEINGRYTKGVSVAYRIELKGNFPVAKQPISANTNSVVTVFDCNGGFFVSECNPQGKLSINKESRTIIENNQAIFQYRLEIDNIGNATLPNVNLSDLLFLPTQLTPGAITTVPNTLNVVINPGGEIRINGDLGELEPGGEIVVTYNIPVAGISSPGQFVVNNLATVSAEGTEASDTASTTLDVVQLASNKCCNVLENGVAEFKISIANVGDSPNTQVKILDDLIVPTGVVARFSDFAGCNAVFASTGKAVPVNTNVQGNVDIRITCDKMDIPKGATAQKIIKLKLVSSSVSGTTLIKNELEKVEPTVPDTQVFLGTGVLPVEANIKVNLSLECQKPCSR